MSQSPVDATPENSSSAAAYLNSWDALARMIRRGRSFSGRERHCCFLNTGASDFADVSSAIGLDLLDDGRAIGVVDWDQDGDLDFWITNRTSPRIRLMRNNLATGDHHLSLRLQGVRCNRDAIGARVEVTPQDRSHRYLKTLRAGEGFLSQSSKWMHFGLGEAKDIEQVSVYWPGDDEPQIFRGLKVDRRYRLVQGVAAAEELPPRESLELTPTDLPPAETSDRARVVLTQRRVLPSLDWTDDTGSPANSVMAGPQLINLWASWCAPCLNELSQLQARCDELKSAGLQIIALNVDGMSAENDPERTKTIAAQLKLPFPSGFPSTRFISQLTELDHQILYREKPLPVPCSLLVDRQGRLAVIYKGPVEVDQLLADVKLLDAASGTLTAAAMPLGGLNITRWFSPDSVTAAQAFLEGGYVDDAKAELNKVLKGNLQGTTVDQVPALRLWASLARQEKNTDQYLKAARRLAQLEPKNPANQIELAIALASSGAHDESEKILRSFEQQQNVTSIVMAGQTRMSLGQIDRAIQSFERADRLKPKSAEIRFNLALACQLHGQTDKAIQLYRELLQQYPGRHDLENNLAWLLATADDDPKHHEEAVQRATSACEAVDYQRAAYMDTLATALARSGDLESARDVARRAIDAARARGQTSLLRKLQQRLETDDYSSE